MTKHAYRAAMQRVEMSDTYQAAMLKTLQNAAENADANSASLAQNARQGRAFPIKKAIVFRRAALGIACGLLLVLAPVLVSALRGNGMFATSKAAPQQMMAANMAEGAPQAACAPIPAEEQTAQNDAGAKGDGALYGVRAAAPQVQSAADTTTTVSEAELADIAAARALLFSGKAYAQTPDKPGGYQTENMVIVQEALVPTENADAKNTENAPVIVCFTVQEEGKAQPTILYVAVEKP